MKKKLKVIIPSIAAALVIIATVLLIRVVPGLTANVDSMMSTAQKYLTEMKYEQAVAEYMRIIELEPMNVEAYRGLAEAYEKMDDYEQAIAVLQQGYDMTRDESLIAYIDGLYTLSAPETEADTETTVELETTAEPETTATPETAPPEPEFVMIGDYQMPANITMLDITAIDEGLSYSYTYAYRFSYNDINGVYHTIPHDMP